MKDEKFPEKVWSLNSIDIGTINSRMHPNPLLRLLMPADLQNSLWNCISFFLAMCFKVKWYRSPFFAWEPKGVYSMMVSLYEWYHKERQKWNSQHLLSLVVYIAKFPDSPYLNGLAVGVGGLENSIIPYSHGHSTFSWSSAMSYKHQGGKFEFSLLHSKANLLELWEPFKLHILFITFFATFMQI